MHAISINRIISSLVPEGNMVRKKAKICAEFRVHENNYNSIFIYDPMKWTKNDKIHSFNPLSKIRQLEGEKGIERANSNRKRRTKGLTGQLEIYERGHHLRAGFRVGESSNRLGRQAIEGAAQGTRPGPMLEVAIGVEVGPAMLAAREKVSVGSVGRRAAILVLGGERSDGNSPWKAGILLSISINWETRDCSSNSHSLRVFSSLRWKREPSRRKRCRSSEIVC